MQTESEWHLDRRVPIALILAIVGQIATFVWFASEMNSRVSALENNHAKLENQNLAVRLTVVETVAIANRDKFNHIDAQLDSIENKLDRELRKP